MQNSNMETNTEQVLEQELQNIAEIELTKLVDRDEDFGVVTFTWTDETAKEVSQVLPYIKERDWANSPVIMLDLKKTYRTSFLTKNISEYNGLFNTDYVVYAKDGTVQIVRADKYYGQGIKMDTLSLPYNEKIARALSQQDGAPYSREQTVYNLNKKFKVSVKTNKAKTSNRRESFSDQI